MMLSWKNYENFSKNNLLTKVISLSGKFKGVVGRTPNQKDFIQAINEKDFILCDSPWGTGKTFLAVGMACQYFLAQKVDKIVFVRNSRNLIKEFGFAPGTWEEKGCALFDQVREYFSEFLGHEEFEKLWKKRAIELTSASIIRGRSFKRAFVVAEEIQESSKDDILLFLSRMDRDSKLVMIGDRNQVPDGNCFFARMFDELDDDAIAKIRMTEEDIQRNKHIYRLCTKIQHIK